MKKMFIVVLLFLFSVSNLPQQIVTENDWFLHFLDGTWCDSSNTYSSIMEYPDNNQEHFQMFQSSGGTEEWTWPGAWDGRFYVVAFWAKKMTYLLPDTFFVKVKMNNANPNVLQVGVMVHLIDSVQQAYMGSYEIFLGSDWQNLSYDMSFAHASGMDYFVTFLFDFYLIALDSSYLSAGIQVDSLSGKYPDGSIVIFDDFGDDITFVGGGDEQNLDLPIDFNLRQNYPNPFNPSTKISWQSPAGSWQVLKIFDVIGNEVATLVDEYKPAGNYEVDFNASNLPSGVYFYKLQAGNFVETKKMIVLK